MEEETEKGKENRRGTGSKPTKKLKWHLCSGFGPFLFFAQALKQAIILYLSCKHASTSPRLYKSNGSGY